jgi:hypothetical protein
MSVLKKPTPKICLTSELEASFKDFIGGKVAELLNNTKIKSIKSQPSEVKEVIKSKLVDLYVVYLETQNPSQKGYALGKFHKAANLITSVSEIEVFFSEIFLIMTKDLGRNDKMVVEVLCILLKIDFLSGFSAS